MQRLLSVLTTLYLLFVYSILTKAQNTNHYTDYMPKYLHWFESYILDKIQYTPNHTIFHFRFICNNATSKGARFHPPKGEYPWYVKGRNMEKEYDVIAVRNIRRDGVLVKDSLGGSQSILSPPTDKIGHTVFTCEIHFERFDKRIKNVDLIEGRGQEFNDSHFNCRDITIKTWEDDLGTKNDSEIKIKTFEDKFMNPPPVMESNQQKSDYTITTEELETEKDLVCDKTLILKQIKFYDNSTNFKGLNDANVTLAIILNYLKAHPKVNIVLYGHTDVFGSKDNNLELSKQRVLKIQRWLTMHGIKTHRISYKWFGSQKPLIQEGHPSNRRIEIKLQCNDR